jgi:AcrR family transcriptional regulator
MPRPAGVRNHDFAEKREALLDRLCDFALQAGVQRPSLRRFARAAKASEPTLRHYFSDRQGLIVAILECLGRDMSARGSDHRTGNMPGGPLDAQLSGLLGGLRERAQIRAHAFGLTEGLADPVVGEAYLEHVLEPRLRAIEDSLGDISPAQRPRPVLRAASLAMLAPLVIMVLHQDMLGGQPRWAFDEMHTLEQIRAGLSAGLGLQPG